MEFNYLKKKIIEFIDEFKKLNLFLKIVAITILFSYLVFGVIFVFMSKFLFEFFYSNYINSLGFDIKTPLYLFVGLSFFFLLPLLLFFKKKTNVYFAMGCFVFLFLIIFGFSFINQSYQSDLPINGRWNYESNNRYVKDFLSNPSCSISKLICNSDKKYFVLEESVKCYFVVNETCPFSFDFLEIHYNFLNDSVGNTRGNSEYFEFNVNRNVTDMWIRPYFLFNNSSKYTFYYNIHLANKYNLEEYNQKQTKENYDKIFLLITLFSLSLFTTIIAMNNLKQLLHK